MKQRTLKQYTKLIKLAKEFDACQNDLIHYQKAESANVEIGNSTYLLNSDHSSLLNRKKRNEKEKQTKPISLNYNYTTSKNLNLNLNRNGKETKLCSPKKKLETGKLKTVENNKIVKKKSTVPSVNPSKHKYDDIEVVYKNKQTNGSKVFVPNSKNDNPNVNKKKKKKKKKKKNETIVKMTAVANGTTTNDTTTNENITNEIITNENITNEIITNEIVTNEIITNDNILTHTANDTPVVNELKNTHMKKKEKTKKRKKKKKKKTDVLKKEKQADQGKSASDLKKSSSKDEFNGKVAEKLKKKKEKNEKKNGNTNEKTNGKKNEKKNGKKNGNTNEKTNEKTNRKTNLNKKKRLVLKKRKIKLRKKSIDLKPDNTSINLKHINKEKVSVREKKSTGFPIVWPPLNEQFHWLVQPPILHCRSYSETMYRYAHNVLPYAYIKLEKGHLLFDKKDCNDRRKCEIKKHDNNAQMEELICSYYKERNFMNNITKDITEEKGLEKGTSTNKTEKRTSTNETEKGTSTNETEKRTSTNKTEKGTYNKTDKKTEKENKSGQEPTNAFLSLNNLNRSRSCNPTKCSTNNTNRYKNQIVINKENHFMKCHNSSSFSKQVVPEQLYGEKEKTRDKEEEEKEEKEKSGSNEIVTSSKESNLLEEKNTQLDIKSCKKLLKALNESSFIVLTKPQKKKKKKSKKKKFV